MHTTSGLNDEDRTPADDGRGGAGVGGLGGGGVLGVATGVGTTLQIPGPVLPCITKEMNIKKRDKHLESEGLLSHEDSSIF